MVFRHCPRAAVVWIRLAESTDGEERVRSAGCILHYDCGRSLRLPRRARSGGWPKGESGAVFVF
jgi:hypothetical protein